MPERPCSVCCPVGSIVGVLGWKGANVKRIVLFGDAIRKVLKCDLGLVGSPIAWDIVRKAHLIRLVNV